MDILYRLGKASAAEIHEELPEPPSYSATRAMLAALLRKEQITFESQGSRYLYKPSQPRTQAASSALKRVLETFYAGSAAEAIAGILAASRKKLNSDEVERLSKLLDEASSERPQRTSKKEQEGAP